MRVIDELRNRVAGIDQQLIRLIARRFAVTETLGQTKRRHRLPLRNWQVEKAVIKKARTLAARLDLPGDMVTSIMQLIISESTTQQEKKYYTARRGTKENVLVIGGLGSMGTWFCHFLRNQGHRVAVYDPRGRSRIFPSHQELKWGLQSATAALIAAPLESTGQIIDRIRSHGYPGLVFDIASLKGHFRRSIDRARRAGLLITSVHPLFGPQTRILSDKIICLCDCGNPAATRRAAGLFQDSAATIVRLSLTEHDRAMAYVLGLSHLVNVLFMDVLTRSGLGYGRVRKAASTTFASQITTAAGVVLENPALYHAIQHYNPFKDELLIQVLQAANRTASAIRRRDPESFQTIIARSRRWLAAGKGNS